MMAALNINFWYKSMMHGLGFTDIYAILWENQLQLAWNSPRDEKSFTAVSMLWTYSLKIYTG